MFFLYSTCHAERRNAPGKPSAKENRMLHFMSHKNFAIYANAFCFQIKLKKKTVRSFNITAFEMMLSMAILKKSHWIESC
jgi:hypothetical protein